MNWTVPTNSFGNYELGAVQVALLMDLRDELQRLNRILYCQNFLAMPHDLKKIVRNTSKKKRKKKV